MLSLVLTLTLFPAAHYLVVPSERSQIDSRQSALLLRAVSDELAKYDALATAGPEADAPVRSCADNEGSCYARMVARAGADGVIVVRAVRYGATDTLSFTLLDGRSGEVQKLVSRTTAPQENALDLVGPLTGEMLGSLTPKAAPGIELTWRSRWSPKPVHRGVFFAGVALTGATLTAAIGVLISQQLSYADFRAYAASGVITADVTPVPIDGALLQEKGRAVQAQTAAMQALFVSGAVLGAATLVLAFFTDFGSDAVWATSNGLAARF